MLSFLDMQTTRRRTAALRILDAFLLLATISLAGTTLLLGGQLVVSLTGRGHVTVPASVRAPFDVGFANGSGVRVTGGEQPSEYRGVPVGEERQLSGVSVRADVQVGREDRDTRAVLAGTTAALGLCLWAGLLALRRLVRSGWAGEPFDRHNVRRLRVLGVAVLAWPFITRLGASLVDRTIDSVPEVKADVSGPGWWVTLLVGVGLFALAEVWREGVELRELERETI
jgi:hypothetical protein